MSTQLLLSDMAAVLAPHNIHQIVRIDMTSCRVRPAFTQAHQIAKNAPHIVPIARP
jgi:hypothetical protein